MKIGKAIQELRKQKGLSKNELCLNTGLNKGYVYRLENNLISSSVAMLERIAEALNMSVSELIQFTKDQKLQ
jgi:transcriptional regulator with XRE-family HTH domain